MRIKQEILHGVASCASIQAREFAANLEERQFSSVSRRPRLPFLLGLSVMGVPIEPPKPTQAGRIPSGISHREKYREAQS